MVTFGLLEHSGDGGFSYVSISSILKFELLVAMIAESSEIFPPELPFDLIELAVVTVAGT